MLNPWKMVKFEDNVNYIHLSRKRGVRIRTFDEQFLSHSVKGESHMIGVWSLTHAGLCLILFKELLDHNYLSDLHPDQEKHKIWIFNSFQQFFFCSVTRHSLLLEHQAWSWQWSDAVAVLVTPHHTGNKVKHEELSFNHILFQMFWDEWSCWN